MSSYQQQSESYLGNAGGAAGSMLGLATSQKSIASRAPSEYANLAAVDSNQSFDEALGIQNRNATRMGINPNSGRFSGLQQKWALARAAAEAGARTRGRMTAENIQFTRLGQAASTANSATSANRGVASDYGDLASNQGFRLGSSGGGVTTSTKGTGKNTGEVKTIGNSAQTVIGKANANLTGGSGSGITNIDGVVNRVASSAGLTDVPATGVTGARQGKDGTWYGSSENYDASSEQNPWNTAVDGATGDDYSGMTDSELGITTQSGSDGEFIDSLNNDASGSDVTAFDEIDSLLGNQGEDFSGVEYVDAGSDSMPLDMGEG